MQLFRRYLTHSIVTVTLVSSPLLGCARDVEGQSVPVNLEVVQSSDSAAQYQLAQRLCCGSGEGKNTAHSYFLYCSAAKKGHKEAQIELARLYESGIPLHKTGEAGITFLLPQDLAKAYLWYFLAEKNGRYGAKSARKSVFKRMSHEQKNESYRMLKQWRKMPCDTP